MRNVLEKQTKDNCERRGPDRGRYSIGFDEAIVLIYFGISTFHQVANCSHSYEA